MHLKWTPILLAGLLSLAYGSDVLDLDDGNFDSSVAEHDVILVEFFAPWCGHCKRLAPEYEKAATALKKNDPAVPLAKVDCTEPGKDTCSKHGVSGYPTLKIFKDGAFSADYDGPRDAPGIIKYMKSKVGPASRNIATVADAESKFEKNQVIVFGFFSDEAGIEKFKKAADKVRDTVLCLHSSAPEVLKKYGHNDAVVLYRPKNMKNKFEDSEVTFDGDLSDLAKFVDENLFGLCGHRSQDNAAKFGSDKPLVIAYYEVDYVLNAKGTNYWRNRIMKVAQKFKDNFIFAISNGADFSYEKEEMGLKGKSKVPQIGVRDPANKKYPMPDEFSMDKFEAFLQDFVDGKLTPYLKSEAIPETNDGPVKVAVATNFDEVVTDVDKDVLIEFYAPWCGHCKKLAPTLEELGEKLSNEDVSIVKMDATANDVPAPFEVSGFPTLYWLPKNKKDSPKKYEGGRDVDDFVKFIAKEATNELNNYNRKGVPRKVDL